LPHLLPKFVPSKSGSTKALSALKLTATKFHSSKVQFYQSQKCFLFCFPNSFLTKSGLAGIYSTKFRFTKVRFYQSPFCYKMIFYQIPFYQSPVLPKSVLLQNDILPNSILPKSGSTKVRFASK
jgi:hypothetical protein